MLSPLGNEASIVSYRPLNAIVVEEKLFHLIDISDIATTMVQLFPKNLLLKCLLPPNYQLELQLVMG